MNKNFFGPFFFGIGIIGMLDGIIFHQLLQWHSIYMHTDRYHQVASDGWFHLFATATIFLAGILLWKAEHHKANSSYFWGSFLLGAGIFNFIEGIVNHHLLEIHHVKPGKYELTADLLFDASGLMLILIGWLLLKKAADKMKTDPIGNASD